MPTFGFARRRRIGWNHPVKPPLPSLPLLAVAVLIGSCREPLPAPPVTPAAVPAPPRTKPAPPAVKPGKLSAIDVTTLFPRQQAGTVLIFDARPTFVAAFGKISGAVSWPRSDFDSGLAVHEAEIRAAKQAGKPVVIYCTDAACPDARAMAEKLAARGHDIAILDGGFAIWKEAGLPTE